MTKRYDKTVQITLTEGEWADLMKATSRFITETGVIVSVTRYAKHIIMEEVRRQTEE